MNVRPARDDELDCAGAVTVAAYETIPEMRTFLADGYGAELADVAGRRAHAEVLVAVEGDRVVGCVTFVPDPRSPLAEQLAAGDCGMRMLAVDPDERGRGIGRALVVACARRAVELGRARLVLTSSDVMAAAQHLYAGLGFERAPALDWEPVPGVVARAFVLEPPTKLS